MNPGMETGTKPACKSPKEPMAKLVQIGPAATPQYWKSAEELRGAERFHGEFPGGLPAPGSANTPENTRRDFLAMMGFTLAAAGLAGCRAPVQNAIPLLVATDDIIPGVANFYATTCRGCPSSCSLLVKQRDGRPIKIEGNAESVLFGGGTCATGQATVLSLYDDARLRGPLWRGQPARWDDLDRQILPALATARAAKQKVVLLSQTIPSPSTLEILSEWGKSYPEFRHVVYDPVSLSAMREANRQSFGRPVVPHYLFDRARVIVAFDADFLGTWLSPVEFARQYAASRRSRSQRARHIQFEAGLSVTGSNADLRLPVAPSEMGITALALLRRIAGKSGLAGVPEGPEPLDAQKLDLVAEELWKHRGESLIVSGCNDVATQMVVNALNVELGNVGKTIDLAHPSWQRNGDDAAMSGLIDEMNRGEIGALMLLDVNPAYDYPEASRFLAGLEKVGLSISFSRRLDETSTRVHAVCPDHHFLEAWGDAEPVESHFSLAQPLIAPLFDTRAAQESLLKWLGAADPNYYNYLREYWNKKMFPRQKTTRDPIAFWEKSLQDGVVVLAADRADVQPRYRSGWQESARSIARAGQLSQAASSDDRYELHCYESVALRDGRHANNPWLQELPDPISKVTWGNYAAVAPALAQKLGVAEGDVLRITSDRGAMELPVFFQPGQEARTISVAIGYGRTQAGKVGRNVGINAYPFAAVVNGARKYSSANVVAEKTGRREKLAGTQSDFSMEGRPIVLETTLEELQHPSPDAKEPLPTLWSEPLPGAHSWGMAIDMDACTGCSACVVACQAENNVPVVGKDQVERLRIMHWIRIDRYYSGSEGAPETVHQPMMCQHCQNAPCETVCPVLATTTNSEGLNQQVYNRCIGTRYCANNCPYKVRRFNWYNYTDNPEYDFNMASPLGRMALNPDVVVRSRGVMEKCSMCIQRIQLAKNIALQGKRDLVDGDIQTACQQACPTQAIVFGDYKDPNSRLSRLRRNQRHYDVLEELGVRPNVGYMKRVRNRMEKA